jgi:hypothetical protein
LARNKVSKGHVEQFRKKRQGNIEKTVTCQATDNFNWGQTLSMSGDVLNRDGAYCFKLKIKSKKIVYNLILVIFKENFLRIVPAALPE